MLQLESDRCRYAPGVEIVVVILRLAWATLGLNAVTEGRCWDNAQFVMET